MPSVSASLLQVPGGGCPVVQVTLTDTNCHGTADLKLTYTVTDLLPHPQPLTVAPLGAGVRGLAYSPSGMQHQVHWDTYKDLAHTVSLPSPLTGEVSVQVMKNGVGGGSASVSFSLDNAGALGCYADFNAPWEVKFPAEFTSMRLGDFTLDGLPDIVTFHPSAQPKMKAWNWNPLERQWKDPVQVGDSSYAWTGLSALEIGDINEDGRPDVIALVGDSPTKSIVHAQPGGMDSPFLWCTTTRNYSSLRFVNPSRPMLLGLDGTNLYTITGAGYQEPCCERALPVSSVAGYAVGRLSDNAPPSVVVATQGWNYYRLTWDAVTHEFAGLQAVSLDPRVEFRELAVGDVTGDGADDIVILLHNYGTLSVVRSPLPLDGGTTTAENWTWFSPGGQTAQALALGDMNADGRQDVLVSTSGVGGSVIHAIRSPSDTGGPGSELAPSPITFTGGSNPRAGDIRVGSVPDGGTVIGFSVLSDASPDTVYMIPGELLNAPPNGQPLPGLGGSSSGQVPPGSLPARKIDFLGDLASFDVDDMNGDGYLDLLAGHRTQEGYDQTEFTCDIWGGSCMGPGTAPSTGRIGAVRSLGRSTQQAVVARGVDGGTGEMLDVVDFGAGPTFPLDQAVVAGGVRSMETYPYPDGGARLYVLGDQSAASVDLLNTTAPSWFPLTDPSGLALVDCDQDGRTEVFTTLPASGIYTVRNVEDGPSGSPLLGAAGPRDLAAADFNHDGVVDFALTGGLPGNTVDVHFGILSGSSYSVQQVPFRYVLPFATDHVRAVELGPERTGALLFSGQSNNQPALLRLGATLPMREPGDTCLDPLRVTVYPGMSITQIPIPTGRKIHDYDLAGAGTSGDVVVQVAGDSAQVQFSVTPVSTVACSVGVSCPGNLSSCTTPINRTQGDFVWLVLAPPGNTINVTLTLGP